MTKLEQIAKTDKALRTTLDAIELTFNNLLDAHWSRLTTDADIIAASKDVEKRVRWDLYRASCEVSVRCSFYELDRNLNDAHIDSYLKSLVRKWKA